MANLPSIKKQDSALEDIGYLTVENFYELEKANNTLLKLQDMFSSVERTLRSSFDLQQEDFKFRKMQADELERIRQEQAIEQGQTPTTPEEVQATVEKPKFEFGLGRALSKLLGGVAIGGLLFLFKDELKKLVETGLRTFFNLTGTQSQFTDELAKIMADNAFIVALAAAIATPFLGPLKGALVAGVVLVGRTVADYIDKQFKEAGMPMGPGSIFEFSLYGATIGSYFGPKGILIGAIVGGVIGLGKMLYTWFEGEKARVQKEIEKSDLPQSRKDELSKAVQQSTVSTAASVQAANLGGGARPTLSSVEQQLKGSQTQARGQSAPLGGGIAPEAVDYLQATALVESSGNPAATAGTSSASGLFQFTEKTWLETVKAMGKDYSLEDRFDPQKSAEVMAFFTKQNKERLKRALGREPSHTDLYMAHFLGSGGAIKFLRALEINPKGNAATVVGNQAAEANKSIFYKDGKSRTLSEVYDLFRGKLEKAKQQISTGNVPPAVSQLSSVEGVGGSTAAAASAITPGPSTDVAAITPVGTTATGAAVIGGTQATQVARDNMIVSAPVITNAPVNNVTNIASTTRKTIVAAQSPRNTDPTFMRVQELNFA